MTVTQKKRQDLKEAFDFSDLDSNGKIDFLEFLTLVEKCGVRIDTPQAQSGFKVLDTDHDGMIGFDEFMEWWRTK